MQKFYYADYLKTKYECYGHFYNLKIKNNIYKCRSVLEIINKNSFDHDLVNKKSDILVIMMNPGSSRPIIDIEIKNYDKNSISNNFIKELVLTQPDNTQYQIMRLMEEKNINHARILNISDLREAKSPNLVKIVNDLKDNNFHSIFSYDRSCELKNYFNLNKSKCIIAGWGRNKDLLSLYKLCLDKIPNNHKLIGKTNEACLYYSHPSPMMQTLKIEWLNYILNNFDN